MGCAASTSSGWGGNSKGPIHPLGSPQAQSATETNQRQATWRLVQQIKKDKETQRLTDTGKDDAKKTIYIGVFGLANSGKSSMLHSMRRHLSRAGLPPQIPLTAPTTCFELFRGPIHAGDVCALDTPGLPCPGWRGMISEAVKMMDRIVWIIDVDVAPMSLDPVITAAAVGASSSVVSSSSSPLVEYDDGEEERLEHSMSELAMLYTEVLNASHREKPSAENADRHAEQAGDAMKKNVAPSLHIVCTMYGSEVFTSPTAAAAASSQAFVGPPFAPAVPSASASSLPPASFPLNTHLQSIEHRIRSSFNRWMLDASIMSTRIRDDDDGGKDSSKSHTLPSFTMSMFDCGWDSERVRAAAMQILLGPAHSSTSTSTSASASIPVDQPATKPPVTIPENVAPATPAPARPNGSVASSPRRSSSVSTNAIASPSKQAWVEKDNAQSEMGSLAAATTSRPATATVRSASTSSINRDASGVPLASAASSTGPDLHG